MMHIDGSSLLPSIESFQFHIPLTSTPKRSNKLQPLSSTLSMSNDSSKQFELSISAITLVQRSPGLSHEKYYRSNRRQRNHNHPSMIIKRIELKYLLYSSRAMKHNKQRQYTNDQMKIYVI
jgi:hypothetical protein